MTRIKKELEAFRLKVDENVWSDVELGESSIDLAGKRLHLFQLPLDMPPSCLHGVELPVPRKNKWSKPITVSYTSNEGKSNQRDVKVEIKAQRMSNQQTVMEVKGGKLMPCSNQPISMYQGFEVVESAETTLPDVTESVHQLPAGLRQRFVPIGNGLGESLDDKAKELILSTKKSAGTQRKRKSMKAARKLEDAVASAPTRHNSAKRTASQRDSSDSDETQELPVKRIKKSSSKTSGKSSVDVSPLKPKKEKKAKL